uniref:Transposase n=1 Tax=Rhabditophanes sp. KR3021 TaxID=114890 RepID=A0AC35TTV5_9BILA
MGYTSIKTRSFIPDAKKRGWKVYHTHKQYPQSCSWKGKQYIYNALIRPAMCYGCQTWTLTKGALHSLEVTERAMLKRIFKLKILDDGKRERLSSEECIGSGV